LAAVVKEEAVRRTWRHDTATNEFCVWNNQEEPRITVSHGMAVYPGNRRTTEDLLEAADQQLCGRKRRIPSRNVTLG
jgi:GGDEF domain-containing protein